MDFGGRLIDEPLAVQRVEDGLSFGRPQGARRRPGIGHRDRRPRGLPMSIERGPRDPDALTERRRLAVGRDGVNGDHQSLSSVSRGLRWIPRISATFFWRVMIV